MKITIILPVHDIIDGNAILSIKSCFGRVSGYILRKAVNTHKIAMIDEIALNCRNIVE